MTEPHPYARDSKAKVNGAVVAEKAHSIAQLMRTKFAPIVWIVAGLLPQGTLLLAGKPKSGKSWFALNLLVACKLLLHFLGRTVAKCDSLYLALEDTPKRVQSRMQTLMSDCINRIDDLEGFEYRNDWRRGVAGAVDLDAYLTEHPTCKIVAVDVLAKIRGTGDQRGAYEQDYEAIACWKSVADKHGILLLIVHHTRKAEADDVFDEVSGTLAINGAVDQIMVLKRLASDPKQATLHMRGRDLVDDHELGLELRAGWWNYIAPAAEIQANDKRREILDILREAQASMTAAGTTQSHGQTKPPNSHESAEPHDRGPAHSPHGRRLPVRTKAREMKSAMGVFHRYNRYIDTRPPCALIPLRALFVSLVSLVSTHTLSLSLVSLVSMREPCRGGGREIRAKKSGNRARSFNSIRDLNP